MPHPETSADSSATAMAGFRAWAHAKAVARARGAQDVADSDGASGPDAGTAARKHKVSQATHNVMVANRGRDTKPELIVRHALREAGLPGYRLQWKAAPGRPDIAYPGRHIAIYVDGCFWHRCPYCDLPLPKSNVDYWRDKFRRNIERDRRNAQQAHDQGWEVIRIWECQLKGDKRDQTLAALVERVRHAGAKNNSKRAVTYIYEQTEPSAEVQAPMKAAQGVEEDPKDGRSAKGEGRTDA